ncbi:MAG TPA: DUF4159 domain-containing protein [Pirellulales bacterium]|jgi:hypothetical protein|nr:DUF4159 domain-containing protein [Pirellulales bacterium]
MPLKTVSLVVAVAILARVSPLRAEVSPEQVRNSIDRAVAYLKRQQNNNGTWPDQPAYSGGITALCTLALLNAGVEPDDERVQKSLKYLRSLPASQTYVVSLQTMVLCAAEPKKDLLLIGRNVKWLEETQISGGERKGAWAYPAGPAGGGGGDPSNSQFALMGLYEAERVGVKIKEKTWRLALQYWSDLQNPDGSWSYGKGVAGTGSMTCAGITSLIIAAGQLSAGDAEVVGGQVHCCHDQKVNQRIEEGIRWLERNFSVHSNPTGVGLKAMQASWLLYYLYGVERTGRMSARRFIGQHDWYREGADMLVRNQDNLSGYWKGTGSQEANPLIGTSLALLFMAKGRRPVLAAKLKHGPLDDWDHHRSDLANLTSYVEKKWERDLTWQVIDPGLASVEDLLQAPVLYFNGQQAPQFTDEQKHRLRDYVDRGGFIFAQSCCGGVEFEEGFRQLMRDMFPEEEYKMRLLPPEHPIWRAEEPVDPRYVRPLWGIDIGCRTSVVFCPDDLSCYWELARAGRRQPLPDKIAAEVAAVCSMGVNVMAYATNRELKWKFESFTTAQSEKPADHFERGKIYAARLLHPGGCNAAPAAVSNLLRVAAEKLKLRVDTQPRELAMTDPQLLHYHIVFMHGRHSFRLTAQERKQLRTYLERGGMLMADAICSSREFTEAFGREMAAIFPEARLERIPPKDPLFTTEFGGEDLASVGRREPQRARGDGPLESQVRQGEPYLEGIKLGNRYAVIFSPYDLSCALENHESLECEGYTRADAARIGLNVLLYSFHQ